MSRLKRYASLFALTLVHALSHAAGPHEHGAATLQVAVDGDRLHVGFSSPLDNLVGFERAPQNEKETAAVRHMVERLRAPESLFVPTADARCTRERVDLDSPALDPGLLGNAGLPRAAPKDAHASISVAFILRCERPKQLTGLEVKAFEAFPNLKRVDANVAGAQKQSSAKLTRGNPRLRW